MKDRLKKAMEDEGVRRAWWDGDVFCIETGSGGVWKILGSSPAAVPTGAPDWAAVRIEAPAP